jgi:hypothetical protein
VNKTADIEWEIALVLDRGPLTLAEMETRLPAEIRNIERTWIGIAVYRMLGDGRIRTVGCDHDRHEGACVIEAVTS